MFALYESCHARDPLPRGDQRCMGRIQANGSYQQEKASADTMQEAGRACLLQLELLTVSSPAETPDAQQSLRRAHDQTLGDVEHSASLSQAHVQCALKLLLCPEEARQQKALEAHQLLEQARAQKADTSYQHLLEQVLTPAGFQSA